MKVVCVEPHYLPTLEFFCAVRHFDAIRLEVNEHFVKQSYRNRSTVLTAQGTQTLSIPLTAKHGKVPLRDVRIDYTQKWQANHWRTLESAYRNAPYFEHYAPDLEPLVMSRPVFLIELLVPLLSFCLKSVRWNKKLELTSAYEVHLTDEVDLRNRILAKKTFEVRPFYRPGTYYQVFGNTFVPNLSVLDLLFCTGPESGAILMRSAGPE